MALSWMSERCPAHAALVCLVQDARRKLLNAVVCGFISHADRRTYLNPPDSQILSRADKLIVLSHSNQPEMAPHGSTAARLDLVALQQQLEAAVLPVSAPKSIVVVGWSGPLDDLSVRRHTRGCMWACM